MTHSEGFGYLFDPGRLFLVYWLFAVEGLARLVHLLGRLSYCALGAGGRPGRKKGLLADSGEVVQLLGSEVLLTGEASLVEKLSLTGCGPLRLLSHLINLLFSHILDVVEVETFLSEVVWVEVAHATLR